MELFELWYLFPTGVGISVIAMSSGISGSNFWLPIYLMMLKVETKTAFWLALITMIFGFGSGVYRNVKEKTINFTMAKKYMVICVPSALLGGFLSIYAPQSILILFFAIFVIGYGTFMLITTALHRVIQQQKTDKINLFTPIVAGFLKGIIATGLGKLIMPQMLKNKNISGFPEAVGTSVLVVFVVNLAAILSRMGPELLEAIYNQWQDVFSILFWVVPSVVLGGQIGPIVSQKIPRNMVLTYVGILLIIVGGLMIMRATEESGKNVFELIFYYYQEIKRIIL